MADERDTLPALLQRGAELAEALVAANERLRLELQAHEARARELERENHNLANLYVAAHQIHATLDLREVLQTINEILVNFIGARTFAIYLRDDDDRLRAVTAENVARAALAPEGPEGPIGAAVASGQAFYAETLDARTPPEAPLAIAPLRLRDQVVGAVAVWSFLAHKEGLTDLDIELFSLLGAHAASALEAARLAAGTGAPRLRFAAFSGLL
jgi:nitrate/nitrite-specific signal transduction histidine kinase